MKSLVIFDLDGTLLNTIDDLGTATNYALKESGYPEHPLDAYPEYVGNGITRLIERALPQELRTEDVIWKVREKFKEYYNQHMADATKPYPGIPELLKNLTQKGIKLAVASNKYQSAAKKLVLHYFPEIPWADIEGQKEGVPTKPDPSVVFEILGKVEVPKAQVLYVGDSDIDIETAKRACVEVVGVTWGFRPARELRRAGADALISEPSQLLPLVDQDMVLIPPSPVS